MNDDDPGYCGLDPITTGPNDPNFKNGLCPSHDKAYEELKRGIDAGGTKVFRDFSTSIIHNVLDAAIIISTAPLYFLVGGIGGILRWGQLERRGKIKPKDFMRGDPNDGL